jgi:hypothetical protein
MKLARGERDVSALQSLPTYAPTLRVEFPQAPALMPWLGIANCVLESRHGDRVSSLHIHSVDEALTGESYTESVIGSWRGHVVRGIRSAPGRPIAAGPKTPIGHVDHIAVDFLAEPFLSYEEFDSLRDVVSRTFPQAQFIMQEHPHCCGIKVDRKIWTYVDGFPPLEIALGPKMSSGTACNPRPAWPA